MAPLGNMASTPPHAIEAYGSSNSYSTRSNKSYFESSDDDLERNSKGFRRLSLLFGQQRVDGETQTTNEKNVEGAFDYATMDDDSCHRLDRSTRKPVVGEWVSYDDRDDSVAGERQDTSKNRDTISELDENENAVLYKTKKGLRRVKMVIQNFDREHQIVHKTGVGIANVKKFVLDGVIDLQKKHSERISR